MEALTKAQGKVLKGIVSFIHRYGFPPTIREIMKELKFTSPGTVQDHLRKLAEKNYIRLKPGLSRGIELAPELLGIPVGGFIGAGKTFAETNPEGYIDPGMLAPKDENTFALRVTGESMSRAGIMDEDIVIVKKQSVAAPGDIVVAVKENEATVRRLKKKGNKWWLCPEVSEELKAEHRPEQLDACPGPGGGAKIVGKVVGLLRSYGLTIIR